MLPFELIKDTPYLALSGELWSVFYEYFNRNWSCYRGFLLYSSYQIELKLVCIKSICNYRVLVQVSITVAPSPVAKGPVLLLLEAEWSNCARMTSTAWRQRRSIMRCVKQLSSCFTLTTNIASSTQLRCICAWKDGYVFQWDRLLNEGLALV